MSAFASRAPLVIAHRGASGYLPEHTLEAKALAHGLAADCIEQDLVLSRDGVPVVLHDIHLDTVTDVAARFPARRRDDGRFYAIDFTVAELKTLRVHERVELRTGRAVYPRRFPVGQGTFRIPTLEEELQLLQGLNRSTGRVAAIYPELKEPAWHRAEGGDLSGAVLPILRRYGYVAKADPCWLQCFDFAEVKRLRTELGWTGRLVMLLEATDPPTGEPQATAEGLAALAKWVDGIGPPIDRIVRWQPDGRAVASGLVQLAHAQRLVVHPYTVRVDALPLHCPSGAELHRQLQAVGVDGVFTDFPDVTRRAFQGVP